MALEQVQSFGYVLSSIMGTLMIGVLIAFGYLLYWACHKLIVRTVKRDAKYILVEELALDKIVEKKGINIDKELIKRAMLRKQLAREKMKTITGGKTFQQKLREEIRDDFFGKEQPKKGEE